LQKYQAATQLAEDLDVAMQASARRFMARQCPSLARYEGTTSGPSYNDPETWDVCPCTIKGLKSKAAASLPDICDPAQPLLDSTRLLVSSVVTNGGAMATEMYNYIANVIEKKAPVDTLVFSSGYDSTLWAAANKGGNTIFLEHDQKWIDVVTEKYGKLDIRLAGYRSLPSDRNELLLSVKNDFANADDKLAMNMLQPCKNFGTILVDGPLGTMGRMQPIYMASKCACASLKANIPLVDVFVHDVDRETERTWSDELLGRQSGHGFQMILWPQKDGHFPGDGGAAPLRHYRFDSVNQIPHCQH
jgi:hypothetical protein